jgi:DEAD/DEAH box helicase domain-containing protein
MRAITFDIEAVSENVGRGKLDIFALELTVVAIHDSSTGEYSSFLKNELSSLWPILERADMLIGYNSDAFDIPLLNRYYPGDISHIRSLDLMVEVQKVLGRRLRLQTLAEATLKKGKTGNGLQAMVWWQEGEIEKVRQYCIEDVRITRALYDYAREHGVLKYKDLKEVRNIALPAGDWEIEREGSALTHPLPF